MFDGKRKKLVKSSLEGWSSLPGGSKLWAGEISIDMMLVGRMYFWGSDKRDGKNMKKATKKAPFISEMNEKVLGPRGNYGKLSCRA